ncbi:MAG TPA: tRNA pseudouridine(38-40) synthase TruA [Chitinophagaceae bacterium]|nr:tRNA pseudouridine(38-40) synthase TruA [Chitinophagaceae bacterium]
MPQRYFLEIMYKGTAYSGFQIQKNAPNTVQQVVEEVFAVLQKQALTMTGSSRTDAGVHALQNFFHFDYDLPIHPQFRYKMNAILPKDIVVKNVYRVDDTAHCRFDALSRSYRYAIYASKDPFLADRSYYYPYTLNVDKMQEAAAVLMEYQDFTSFSKRNTQVKTFVCSITKSGWQQEGSELCYYVSANRFLRGMVRGLTGTMLQVGRDKLSIRQFRDIIEARDCRQADFSVPGHGLFLTAVAYPPALLANPLPLR